MNKTKFMKAAFRNVALVVAGILIGGFAVEMARNVVHAQGQGEELVPGVRMGTVLFQNAVAGRVIADQVIVHDIDVMKLIENLTNVLARSSIVVPKSELEAAVEQAKVPHIAIRQPGGPPVPKK